MNRVMIIHKAATEESDLSINITELANGYDRETLRNEGKVIADALWNLLPSYTIDGLIARLKKLEDDLQNEWDAVNDTD